MVEKLKHFVRTEKKLQPKFLKKKMQTKNGLSLSFECNTKKAEHVSTPTSPPLYFLRTRLH